MTNRKCLWLPILYVGNIMGYLWTNGSKKYSKLHQLFIKYEEIKVMGFGTVKIFLMSYITRLFNNIHIVLQILLILNIWIYIIWILNHYYILHFDKSKIKENLQFNQYFSIDFKISF